MASFITAGNATNGLQVSSDNTGILELRTGTGSGTTALTLNTSQNAGLGVTPSAWALSGLSAIQIKNAGFAGYLNNSYVQANAYFDGSGTARYIANGFATQYVQTSGQHIFYTAASGTAGNTLSSNIQAMTLDASGNLGIGTSSPTEKLMVAGSIRLTSNANDFNVLGGQFDFASNATRISAYNSTGGIIQFFTNASGGTVLERARITSDGNFLVGTTDSSTASGNGCKILPSGKFGAVGTTAALSDTYNYYNSTAGAYRFYVTSAGVINATSTTITAISDQRLKENIEDIDVGLDAVMALKPRKFDWKEGKGKDKKGDRGWIAQEFEQVFPDMISTWKDEPPEGEEPYKAVNADLIPILVKAIQELNTKVEALEAQLKGNA